MKTPSPVTIVPVAAGHVTTEAERRPATVALDRVLRGPLARPLMRLWKELDALVQDGSLLGVELDPKHPDCPCFLLNVAPDKPLFYVELFRGDLDDASEEDEVPLCVLMNWLGSDADPGYWETEWEWETEAGEPGAASSETDGVPTWAEDRDFREILRLVLLMTETLPGTDGGTA